MTDTTTQLAIPRRTLFIWTEHTPFILAMATAIAIKLWLVAAQPFLAMLSPHDDQLFVQQANNILSGAWLGGYDQFTLIKGQMYPLFIALSHLATVPLQLAEHLLYAFACVLTVVALAPDVRRQRWLLLIFLVLLYNPFTYHFEGMGRAFRLGTYPALALLVLACAYGLASRLTCYRGRPLAWAIGLGLALGAFWHTREESIFMLPALVLIAGYTLVRAWRERPAALAKVVALCLIPVALWGAITLALDTMNWLHYREFATIEIETPEFDSAYGGLLRIETPHFRRFFPVTREARELAYQVSPAMRELQPFLEGHLGNEWSLGYGDMPAALFIWAFRDSVAAAGYYDNAPATLAFYQRIGTEIDAACAAGRLHCRWRLTALMPPWHAQYNALALPALYDTVRQLVTFGGFSPRTYGYLSRGNAALMALYANVTRENLRTSITRNLEAAPAYDRELDRRKIARLRQIGWLYQMLSPALFVLCLGSSLATFGCQLLRRKFEFLTLFSIAVLLAIGAICVILTLVVLTSYSEIQRPLNSAYPLLLLFFCVSLTDLAKRRWWTRFGRKRVAVPVEQ